MMKMDPTRELTKLQPPGSKPIRFKMDMMPKEFVHKSDLMDPPPVSVVYGDFTPHYISKSIYDENSNIKGKLSTILPGELNNIRKITDPYFSLFNGPFMNRDGLMLANIDALYKLSGHFNGLLVEQIDNDRFTFATIDDKEGGMVQYIQWRNPLSRGHGITEIRKDGKSITEYQYLNMNRFDASYDGKNKGSVIDEWELFTKYVLLNTGLLELVVANGEVESDHQSKEMANTRLFLVEILSSLIMVRGRESLNPLDVKVRKGGSCVIRIFDTMTKMSAQLIYVLTRCFYKVQFIKPVTLNPDDSTKYIICLDKHDDVSVSKWIVILKQLVSMYDSPSETRHISSFIEIDDDFATWLTDQNDLLMNDENKSIRQILNYHETGMIEQVQRVNLAKCFLIWNIGESSPTVCAMRKQLSRQTTYKTRIRG